MCGNIHGHPRNCIAGPSSWIEMTMLLPPWAIEKSTQCEAANNTAQHRKTQEWQLLAYSPKQQLISLGKNGLPSHFKACTFHTLVGSLIPPWLHHFTTQGPASLLSGWPLLRRALPSLCGPHYNMKANKLAVRSFLQLLKLVARLVVSYKSNCSLPWEDLSKE